MPPELDVKLNGTDAEFISRNHGIDEPFISQENDTKSQNDTISKAIEVIKPFSMNDLLTN